MSEDQTVIYLFGGTKLMFPSDEETLILFKQMLDNSKIWDYTRKEWYEGKNIIAIDRITEE